MSYNNYFSIRSYTLQSRSHHHWYHQLVIPLQGSIALTVGQFSGLAKVGDCVVIRAGQVHEFSANQSARFVVVDTDSLPASLIDATLQKFCIDPSLLSFVLYVEQQLNQTANQQLERAMFELLLELLNQQSFTKQIDRRIEAAMFAIEEDLSVSHPIERLASTACLSATQFKKLFKQHIGTTVARHITTLRMNKARALLIHTDTPISIVAEKVGYLNSSAFSRQFKLSFGDSPSAMR